MYDRTAIRTVEVTDRERELRAVGLGASAAGGSSSRTSTRP
jgi:hypothetical protein